MEKLIELLNEYEEVKYWRYWEYEFAFDSCIRSRKDAELLNETIISKKYWFIERLVENDKIDDSKVWYSDMLSVQYHDLVNDYKYEWLIMILAISDNPISDLCSYLK